MERAFLDREELERQLRAQPLVTPKELAEICSEGSIFFRLMGQLVRDRDEFNTSGLRDADLISEEGRLQAIKSQGRIQGRAEFLENIMDLIIEGAGDADGTED